MKIAKTAIIEDNVKLGKNCEIGEFSIIKEGTILGDNCKVGNNAIIGPFVVTKDNNKFGNYCYVGGEPQDLDFNNEKSYVKIGNNNSIREFVTIHRGTEKNSETKIGNNNYIMAYAHMGHNSKIGNNNILTNSCQLAGYSSIGNYSVISAFTAVHQFTKISDYAMCGGGCLVNKDVPPFSMMWGQPAKIIGINIVGLKRNKFSIDDIKEVKELYKIMFQSKLPYSKAIEKIENEYNDSKNAQLLIDSYKNSKRGLSAFGRNR